MKVFKCLKELREDNSCKLVYYHVCNILKNDIPSFMHDFIDIDFMYYLGGYVHVVENFDDLKEITTWKEKNDTEWYNIIEKADEFDVLEKLNNHYFLVYNVTNNSGGHSYYVPTDIANKCENLLLSYRLTQRAQE